MHSAHASSRCAETKKISSTVTKKPNGNELRVRVTSRDISNEGLSGSGE